MRNALLQSRLWHRSRSTITLTRFRQYSSQDDGKQTDHEVNQKSAPRPSHRTELWPDHRTIVERLPQDQIRRDGRHTYRLRKYGNRELPLPPLLNPAVHEQEMKYTKLDAQVTGRDVLRSRMRKDLHANPYAAALLTPIRHCQYTGARLPRHFLDRFRLHRLKDQRKAALRPYEELGHDEAADLSKGGTYVGSHPDIFKELARRKIWAKLINRPTAQQAANIFNMNPQSHNLLGKIDYDKGIAERFEQEHKQRLQKEFDSLMRRHPEFVMDEQSGSTRPWETTAFICFDEDVLRISLHHGLPCYHMPRSDLISHETSKTTDAVPDFISLAKRFDTVALLLALDRYFTFRDATSSDDITTHSIYNVNMETKAEEEDGMTHEDIETQLLLLYRID